MVLHVRSIDRSGFPNKSKFPCCNRLFIVICVCAVLIQPLARADDLLVLSRDEWEQDEVDQLNENDELRIQASVEARRRTFEAMLVRSTLGETDEESAKTLLHVNLRNEVQIVRQRFSLSESDCHKLELAGRGDIKRLFDQVANFRSIYLASGTKLPTCVAFQRLVKDFVSNSVPRPSESIYGKTLKQIVRTRAAEADPERDLHYQRVMMILVSSNLTKFRLQDAQRPALTELIQSRIQNSPPIVFDEFEELQARTRSIPAEEFEKILSREQYLELKENLEFLQKQTMAQVKRR